MYSGYVFMSEKNLGSYLVRFSDIGESMSKALNFVMSRLCGQGSFDIPRQILQEVFKDNWLDRNMPSSLEDKMVYSLIRPRVLKDIEMFYGENINIDLNQVECTTIGDYARIYRIPPEHTNHREIISADLVSFMPYGLDSTYRDNTTVNTMATNNNELVHYASQVVSSVSTVPSVASSRVEVVGYNTLRVSDRQRFRASYYIKAFVANDSNLANLPAQSFHDLLQLCILATKAYCFNEMNVTMGETYLQRGQELGVFSETIRNWSSAAEDYYTMLKEEWSVQGILANEDVCNGYLAMMVPMGI